MTKQNRFKYNLKRSYGITPEDYNTMFEKQQGCCAICGKHQSNFKRALHVDHCHDTGQVRDLLCPQCNIGVGWVERNQDVMEKAIEYLKKHESIPSV